jgi:hypothetical protein
MDKIEEQFIRKAEEWLSLMKKKDSAALARKLEQLKAKLTQIDSEVAKSYETMYKMLDAAEK